MKVKINSTKKNSPTTKLVLLCLAEHANGKTGVCWPSVKRIMEETGLARRTVQRHLKILDQTGLMKRFDRHRINGGQTSTNYQLLRDDAKVDAERSCDTGREVQRRPQEEPEVKPSRDSYLEAWSEKRFEEFYEAWPRKDQKLSARAAYKRALSKTSWVVLLQQSAVYAGAVDPWEPRYTTAAHRWLDDERWLDGDLSGGIQ